MSPMSPRHKSKAAWKYKIEINTITYTFSEKRKESS